MIRVSIAGMHRTLQQTHSIYN